MSRPATVEITFVVEGHVLVTPSLLTCGHCHKTLTITLPVSERLMKATVRAFDKTHRNCPSQANTTAAESRRSTP